MVNYQLLEEVLRGLNEDLFWEYSAMIQYIQHAAMLHGAEYFALIEELEEHAEEEKEHAITISNIIQYLGGVPTVEVGARLISDDNEEMLLQDLQGEYDAISRYNERISQLEALEMFDIAQQLREISSNEQEHAHDLKITLGIDHNRPTIPNLEKVYPVGKDNGYTRTKY